MILEDGQASLSHLIIGTVGTIVAYLLIPTLLLFVEAPTTSNYGRPLTP